MSSRARIRRALVVALACAAALAAPALAQTPEQTAAWNKVRDAFAGSGANLDPCTFAQADLEAALAGIPPELRETVPDIRRAIEDGIRAHADGACDGVEPTASNDTATTPGAVAPPATTPTTTPDAAAAPGATTPAPASPATPTGDGTVTTPSVQQPGVSRDRTPLVVGLVALGALLVLALLLWGVARLRGWDPPWIARMRHAWREAGYRATSTWSEFTDWLRLGR